MTELRANQDTLNELMDLKYGPKETWGWGVQLRRDFSYYTPDDYYEALLLQNVTDKTAWLDVGCGSSMFPNNIRLAELLSKRCQLLVGLDPSDNIDSNPFVHERVKGQIDDYSGDVRFDLITLRMVAEHIADPVSAVSAIVRLLNPEGMVLIYTVSKWAPVSIVAAATPMWVHHSVKRLLWNCEEKDTFPVVYKMNTRRDLERLFAGAGARECYFEYLDDCRSFQKWKLLNTAELRLRQVFRGCGFGYPESCLLAAYSKGGGAEAQVSPGH